VECVGGIFIFVTIAALVATDEPVSNRQLITILIILGAVTVILTSLWLWLRHRMTALFYIVGAGVMYGFVATLAKVVISRIQSGDFEWLTVTCVVALLLAAVVGAYFVQTAYSSGPPDLVIAGLTVIDPIVAILIGLLVLGEAQNAPLWAYIGFGIAGVIAVIGVYDLARNHPQIKSDSGGLPITRGSDADEPPAAKPKSTTPRFDEAVAKVWPNPPVDDDRPPRH
jgi:drug/metabolite transporter (DMT)-like permease